MIPVECGNSTAVSVISEHYNVELSISSITAVSFNKVKLRSTIIRAVSIKLKCNVVTHAVSTK